MVRFKPNAVVQWTQDHRFHGKEAILNIIVSHVVPEHQSYARVHPAFMSYADVMAMNFNRWRHDTRSWSIQPHHLPETIRANLPQEVIAREENVKVEASRAATIQAQQQAQARHFAEQQSEARRVAAQQAALSEQKRQAEALRAQQERARQAEMLRVQQETIRKKNEEEQRVNALLQRCVSALQEAEQVMQSGTFGKEVRSLLLSEMNGREGVVRYAKACLNGDVLYSDLELIEKSADTFRERRLAALEVEKLNAIEEEKQKIEAARIAEVQAQQERIRAEQVAREQAEALCLAQEKRRLEAERHNEQAHFMETIFCERRRKYENFFEEHRVHQEVFLKETAALQRNLSFFEAFDSLPNTHQTMQAQNTVDSIIYQISLLVP